MTGNDLKVLRAKLGWTIEQMSGFMCTTNMTIWRWENRVQGTIPKKLSGIELVVLEMIKKCAEYDNQLGFKLWGWFDRLGHGHCIMQLAMMDYKLYAAKKGFDISTQCPECGAAIIHARLQRKSDPKPIDFEE